MLCISCIIYNIVANTCNLNELTITKRLVAGGSIGLPSSLVTTQCGRKAVSELGERDPHQLSTPPQSQPPYPTSTLKRVSRENPMLRPQVINFRPILTSYMTSFYRTSLIYKCSLSYIYLFIAVVKVCLLYTSRCV